MNRRGNNYLERLKAKQEAARTGAERTADKPISEITSNELDQEAARLEAELRRSREQAVEVGRQEVAGRGSGRIIFPRRKKRPWK